MDAGGLRHSTRRSPSRTELDASPERAAEVRGLGGLSRAAVGRHARGDLAACAKRPPSGSRMEEFRTPSHRRQEDSVSSVRGAGRQIAENAWTGRKSVACPQDRQQRDARETLNLRGPSGPKARNRKLYLFIPPLQVFMTAILSFSRKESTITKTAGPSTVSVTSEIR